jgi:hypothetical protein
MPLKEAVISRFVDPDFGALELIETQTEASVNGGPRKPLVFREWTGKREDLHATLSISNTDNPPKVPDEIRTAFRAVTSDVRGFKRRIARRELELARSWSVQRSKDLELDEEKFLGLLEIEGFTIGERRLTVWLRETADIFAGHVLEVRVEHGSITEVCLAG